MPQQLYTPFMAQAGANIGNAFMQYQGNKRQSQSDAQMKELTKSAYMGDQQALAHLTAINPQVANQIQQSWRHQKMDAVSTAGAQVKAQDRQRDQTIEADQIKQEILIEASKMGTFEEALAYTTRRTKEMESVLGPMPPLSEDAYNQVRQAQAKAPEQVSDLDKARTEEIKAKTANLKREDTSAPKLSDTQSKAAGFYSRMISSQNEIDRVLKENPKFEAESWTETGPAAISNMFASTEFQQYKQGADDWIRAKLRKESGAVISEDEMNKEYSTYFPVFGDSKKVIKQKQRARKVAEDAMKLGAGKADLSKVKPTKAIKRQGKYKGRTVIEYADGTVEYAD